MELKEVKDVCSKVTGYKMRCRAEKLGRSYTKIVVWNNAENKDHEFTNTNGLFILSEERIIENKVVASMDGNILLETLHNMMLALHIHEFYEYFKYDKKTIQSPHFNILEKR